jgi:hypothetical protein
MLGRNSYKVKLGKAVCGGPPNLDSYYVVLANADRSLKWISRTMRSDEDNDDELTGEAQLQPTLL